MHVCSGTQHGAQQQTNTTALSSQSHQLLPILLRTRYESLQFLISIDLLKEILRRNKKEKKNRKSLPFRAKFRVKNSASFLEQKIRISRPLLLVISWLLAGLLLGVSQSESVVCLCFSFCIALHEKYQSTITPPQQQTLLYKAQQVYGFVLTIFFFLYSFLSFSASQLALLSPPTPSHVSAHTRIHTHIYIKPPQWPPSNTPDQPLETTIIVVLLQSPHLQLSRTRI